MMMATDPCMHVICKKVNYPSKIYFFLEAGFEKKFH